MLSLVGMALALACDPPTAGFVLSDLRTTIEADTLNVHIEDYGDAGDGVVIGSAEVRVSLVTAATTLGRLAEPAGALAGGLGSPASRTAYNFLLLVNKVMVTNRLTGRTTSFELPNRYAGGSSGPVYTPLFFVSASLDRVYALYQIAVSDGSARIGWATVPLTGGSVTPAVSDASVNFAFADLASGIQTVYDAAQVVVLKTQGNTCATTLALSYDAAGVYWRAEDMRPERVDLRSGQPLMYTTRYGIGECVDCGVEVTSTNLATGEVAVVIELSTKELEDTVYPPIETNAQVAADDGSSIRLTATILMGIFGGLFIFVVGALVGYKVKGRRMRGRVSLAKAEPDLKEKSSAYASQSSTSAFSVNNMFSAGDIASIAKTHMTAGRAERGAGDRNSLTEARSETRSAPGGSVSDLRSASLPSAHARNSSRALEADQVH